jgi:hypothetical protein
MQNIFFKTIGATLTAALLAVNLNAAPDNNRWAQQVNYKLAAATAYLNIESTYQPSHETALGNLRQNTYEERTYNLQAGVDYYFIGECDQDCSDLDIKLYDENYNLVDQDVKPDNSPVVHVRPKWTGQFHMRVIMSRCDDNPCYWGVGAYDPK